MAITSHDSDKCVKPGLVMGGASILYTFHANRGVSVSVASARAKFQVWLYFSSAMHSAVTSIDWVIYSVKGRAARVRPANALTMPKALK